MVTQAQNALAVSHHNHLNVILFDVVQNLANLALFLHRDEQSARLQEVVTELLTSFPHRRCIDDGHHFFDVVTDHFKKERFIGVMQRIQIEVTLDGHGERTHEGDRTTGLLFERFHASR